MSREISRTITACCSDGGAAFTVSFDAAEISAEIKACLEKRLLKKGVAVKWSEQPASPELNIRVVAMDQGNQFLRYLLPFIAPAVLEVEGELALAAGSIQQLHYIQRAQMGLFGGSARSMLKVCAQGVAAKIAGEVIRGLKV